jgi:hypothetical protein
MAKPHAFADPVVVQLGKHCTATPTATPTNNSGSGKRQIQKICGRELQRAVVNKLIRIPLSAPLKLPSQPSKTQRKAHKRAVPPMNNCGGSNLVNSLKGGPILHGRMEF